jgi:putative ABC transport system permease protein
MSAWRPALRIARRGVKRNLGRSILIAALIAIPVAGASLVDVLARTLSDHARQAELNLGAADAQIGGGMFKLRRSPAPGTASHDADFKQYLPKGTRIVPAPTSKPIVLARDGNTITLTDPDAPPLPGAAGRVEIFGQSSVTLVSADPREPMHRQASRVSEGRAPRNATEVLVTKHLADRLKITLGTKIATQGKPLTVTGLSTSPFCLTCDQVVALPDREQEPIAFLVDVPDGTDEAALWRTLNDHKISLYTRAQGDYGEPPSGDELRAAALVTLIAGFGLLEVILLAGTAFAVGARRQVRTLGLVAASGGEPQDVRRIVLAEGVVLGLLGALVGAVLGSAGAVLLHPVWERLDDAEITHFVFKPIDLAIAILIGTLAGVAAAAAPAIGAARMKPVDALAGRFRITTAQSRRTPLIGLGLLAAGALAGLLGNQLLSGSFRAYEQALAKVKETGGVRPEAASTGPVVMVLLGAVLLVAAVVTLAPTVIGRLAKAGAQLPVASRLAVRDAARHRHRTGPTTSAIAVAVAGSVVIACVAAASNRAEQLKHVADLPPHTLAIESGSTTQVAAKAAATGLPGAKVVTPTLPLADKDEAAPPGMPVEETRGLMAEPSCDTPPCEVVGGPLAMGDAAGLAAATLTGADAEQARKQLEAGRVVFFGAPGTGGETTLDIHAGPQQYRLPGYVIEHPSAYGALPVGLVPASVATRQGWEIKPGRAFVSYSAKATAPQVEAALQRAQAKGAYAHIDTPPEVPGNTILLIVVIGAAFVTLAGAAISIALSSAEGRADLATLAAVGAAPRRRRALAASQAVLIAGVGCALGVVIGTFVAYTLRSTTGAPGFVVPWANLAATAIVVPLLATAVAALFTPSRLPLVRRAA